MNLTPEHTQMPENLSDTGKLAYKTIMKVLENVGSIDTGGCVTFYSPIQWHARNEEYGLKSELIICYDGGTVREFFDDGPLVGLMIDALDEVGLYSEPCTCWYSAVYKKA